MSYYKILFSPTGGTQKTADMLCAPLSSNWTQIDLSLPLQQDALPTFTPEDVCVAAIPSFGGRVPDIAVERLRLCSGNGAKAVLLCVYGNRAYEDTLSQLQDVLEEKGFHCIAAVAAIAEHSIMRQFAAGRPDAADQTELTAFAEKIREKLTCEASSLAPLPGSHGTYKEYNGTPFKPQVSENCTACGLCAEQCPVGAIDPAAPQETDPDACISCMRCIAVCPVQARAVNPTLLANASAKRAPAFAGRKENELFL